MESNRIWCQPNRPPLVSADMGGVNRTHDPY